MKFAHRCLLLPLYFVINGCGEPGSAGPELPFTADIIESETGALSGPLPVPTRSSPLPHNVDAPTSYEETESGLKYRILRTGNDQKPTVEDTVVVFYRGELDDGTIFDSSYQRKKADVFPLNSVVQGWQEGLPLIGVGGMIEMIVPPELGYGANGQGGSIPPNATLTFVIELEAIR